MSTAYMSCRGCSSVRVHDYHYFYCRSLGEQEKPDRAYTGGWYRLYGYAQTPINCPYRGAVMTSKTNPSPKAATGASETHPAGELTPIKEGAADNAPPAIRYSSGIAALADALESADWSNVSIGNKVMLQCAISTLRTISSATGGYEPVAWLAEYDGHVSVTANHDTMSQWKDVLGRKITPLHAIQATGGDAVAGEAFDVMSTIDPDYAESFERFPDIAGCGTPGCTDPNCEYGKEDDAALAALRSPDVAAIPLEPTVEQVRSACLSYRHDFGLLTVVEAAIVKSEAREWLRAWQKEGLIASAQAVAAKPTYAQLAEWVQHLDWDAGLTTADEIRQLRALIQRIVSTAPAQVLVCGGRDYADSHHNTPRRR